MLSAAGAAVVANTLLEPSVVWVLAALGTAIVVALPLLLNRKAMGTGDIKLGLLLGGALGTAVLDALLIGFLAIVVVALASATPRAPSVQARTERSSRGHRARASSDCPPT